MKQEIRVTLTLEVDATLSKKQEAEIYETEKVEDNKLFLLFGEDACRAYDYDGVDELETEIEENNISYSIMEVNADTTIADVLQEYSGWGDYSFISEEDFNRISNL